MRYFYGPVYSRRLGYSLGVDLLPSKVCTFECVYCQLGRTPRKTLRRFSYVKLPLFREELKRVLKVSRRIDYVTISGSGEPTLHKDLDVIIRTIRKVSKKRFPVCVITNGSLLYRRQVRRELLEADVVMPSLDAPCAGIFKKINRPHKDISFKKVVEGLCKFRKEYKGKLWLEVMLVSGINHREKTAMEFKRLVDLIKPARVYLNIPVRPAPGTLKNLMPSNETVNMYKRILGKSCRNVSSARRKKSAAGKGVTEDMVLGSLRRRPQTAGDLARSLSASASAVNRCLQALLKRHKIRQIVRGRQIYFAQRS